MRMRTIRAAVDELRAKDPDTGVTVYAVRQLVKNNQLPYVRVGVKNLIALEHLEELFQTGGNNNE